MAHSYLDMMPRFWISPNIHAPIVVKKCNLFIRIYIIIYDQLTCNYFINISGAYGED
jgi:hypothetical protein